MRVLVCEDNLMWSARLMNGVKGAGYEAILVDKLKEELPAAEVAIINLGSMRLDPEKLVSGLKAQGTYVIGHAGHKEKPLLAMGEEYGCDQIVTNSTLANKLPELLAKLNESV